MSTSFSMHISRIFYSMLQMLPVRLNIYTYYLFLVRNLNLYFEIFWILAKLANMEFKTIQVFFLWFVVSVHGQTKYCCTPAKWESVNLITDARVDTTGSKKPIFTEVSLYSVAKLLLIYNYMNIGHYNKNCETFYILKYITIYAFSSVSFYCH